MRNKVVVTKYRQGGHNVAQCHGCDKDWDLFTDPSLRNDMIRHVRQTGHHVVRESNSVSHYDRESSDA